MPTADFEAEVESTAGNIEKSAEIHDRNKELIREYLRDQRLNGLADATLSRNLSRMKIVAEHVDKPFDEMDKDDVKDVIEWVQGRDYTEETVATYKTVIRAFFKWLDPDDNGEAPETVAWIKLGSVNGSSGKLPTDLLTQDDIEKQVEAAKNPRDKALIWLLYETGARIGELIDINVGDIEDRERGKGKKVVIDGKTGSRRVPIRKSVPAINSWLNAHPNPEKGAPMWCKIQQGKPNRTLDATQLDGLEEVYGIGPSMADRLREAGIETPTDLVQRDAEEIGSIEGISVSRAQGWLDLFDPDAGGEDIEQLGYRYIRDKILKDTMERAGIDKPSNPHHYRHSRASHLATEYKEATLCEWFGWVQGSDVPAKYVHLSGRDLDEAFDKLHGVYEPEEEETEPDVAECWRCEELNDPGARFCSRCGAALDEEAQEIREDVQQDVGAEKALAGLNEIEDLSEEALEELANDDEIMAQLIQTRSERSS